ncbi:energy transducer TonB family protein [Aminobacter carboxidus]|uniref:Energy transducer TonB n=1 Tax=Aminobacter carboxidus TaxID=376165 RepID=A0ABR9GQB5_9HYPH|nr:energy transducer TonB [Aminobacter carboxidus]MBE1205870.1 energy transducer TonB [Aminobacter carboxidus]
MSAATHEAFSFGGISRGEAVLWSTAAAVILSVHMAGAWYLNQQPPMMMEDMQAQSAVMIDLAPMAMAPEAVQQDATDMVDSAAAESVEEVSETIPPDPVEPVTEPVEPLEQVAELTPEPLEEVTEAEPIEEVIPDIVEAPLPEVAMAIPEPRPEVKKPKPVEKPVREKKPVQKKPEPVKQAKVEKKPAPSAPAAKKSAQNADSVRAPAPGQGGGKAMSPARWQSRVFAHLNRHKPRNARNRGVVQVQFSFNAGGDVLSVKLLNSSGDPALDEAAVSLVRRSSPIPAPPPAVPTSIVVPIDFKR